MLGLVAKELIKVAIKHYSRYYKLEGRAFNSLYKGFRPGVARGVRHGLASGSVIGSVLKNDFSDDSTDGIPQKKQYGSPARSSYKARGRRPGRFNRRYNRFQRFNKKCGCPSPC